MIPPQRRLPLSTPRGDNHMETLSRSVHDPLGSRFTKVASLTIVRGQQDMKRRSLRLVFVYML